MALIKCPECGNEISDKAKTCVNCGAIITVNEKKVICSECETILDGETNVCPNCGCPIISDQAEVPDANEMDVVSEKTTIIDLPIIENVNNNSYNKKRRNIIALGSISILLIIVIYFATANVRSYNSAMNDIKNKKYEIALNKLEKLDDYKNSIEKIKTCKYELGKKAFTDASYKKAIDYFEATKGYKDSDSLLADAEHMYLVSNDKTPPKFNDLPTEIELEQNDNFDVKQWIENNGVTISDNVSDISVIDVKSNNVDTSTPGDYSFVLSASDEAKNVIEATVLVKVKKLYTESEIISTVYYNFPNLETDKDGIVEGISYNQNDKKLAINIVYNGMAKILLQVDYGLMDKSEWKKITDTVDELSNSVKKVLINSGYKDVNVLVCLLNDVNKSNTLHAALDGVVLADALKQ